MTKRNRTTLKANQATKINTNGTRDVTALEVRTEMADLADSMYMEEDGARKHEHAGTRAPLTTDNAAAGFGVGSTYAWKPASPSTVAARKWTLVRIDAVDVAIWEEEAMKGSIAPIALSGSAADLDVALGTMAEESTADWVPKGQQDVMKHDAQGNINYPRKAGFPLDKVLVWQNTGGSGAKPTNAGPYDVYPGVAVGTRRTIRVTGGNVTVGLGDMDAHHRCAAGGEIVVTLPNNTTTALPIDTEGRVWRSGAGPVKIVAQGGATINGVSGGQVTIGTQFAFVDWKKVDVNAYEVWGSSFSFAVVAATVTFPASYGSVVGDGDYWVLTMAPGTGGQLAITGASLSVDYLLVAGGGSGGKGKAGGGGGGQAIYKTAMTLNIGNYPITIGAGIPGTATNGNGTIGNNSTFNGDTALGGGAGTGSGAVGGNGGNGGGAGGGSGSGTHAGGTSTATPAGFPGGSATRSGTGGEQAGGGGGGAGGPGGNASIQTGNSTGGDGGAPFYWAISGVNKPYAPGGRGFSSGTLGITPAGSTNPGAGGAAVASGTSGAGVAGELVIRMAKAAVLSITGI